MALNENMLYPELSKQVLEVFEYVKLKLPGGMDEQLYKIAMFNTFKRRGIPVVKEKELSVWFDGDVIGTFRADLVVGNEPDCIVLELKSSESIHPANVAQLINYLIITHYNVGYLLNFSGKRYYQRVCNPEIKGKQLNDD